MKCGLRCGAFTIAAYVAAVVALTVILLGGVASAQVSHDNPSGRPIFGIVRVCGKLELTETVSSCETLQTRNSFVDMAACRVAVPLMLREQIDAIVRQYPDAVLNAEWYCTVLEGVYDS